MDTDTSDALLKSSKYRLAKNVRLVTNTDSNTGELHKIEGVSTALEIDNGTIVASTSVRDIGVYVIKGEDSSKPKEWSIYTIKQDGTKSKIFGPCSEELGEYE